MTALESSLTEERDRLLAELAAVTAERDKLLAEAFEFAQVVNRALDGISWDGEPRASLGLPAER